ncbi:MAG: membrane protease subunit, stomatin/prohibitin [Cytophagales bacterium]|nr:MAG: membrane protease subunit, stomatin/prohibitin [Cytophagales bacterium]
MFGIKYIKFDATTYVIRYSGGKIVKEGRGLSFFYLAYNTSIVAIPMGSNDVQFYFNESTADFQTISIQGQITYRVVNPKQLSELLDFSVDNKGINKTDDAEKITQRLSNEAQTATSSLIQSLNLKEALRSAKKIEEAIKNGVQNSEAIKLLGIEPINVNITAVKATPEMERALEAEARENVQKEADQAIYNRRNFAVEQERKIKESELNTEIAVEEKRKQIVEKQMETKLMTEESNKKINDLRMQADINLEEQRKNLISLKSTNQKQEADAFNYSLKAQLEPYQSLDWKTIMAIKGGGNAQTNIAIAFRELAENSQKIANLNISPDLLSNLLQNDED